MLRRLLSSVGRSRLLTQRLGRGMTMMTSSSSLSASPTSSSSSSSSVAALVSSWSSSSRLARRTMASEKRAEAEFVETTAKVDAESAAVYDVDLDEIVDGDFVDVRTGGALQDRSTARRQDIPMSAQKLNDVCRLVRGLSVDEAMTQMQLSHKKAARYIRAAIHNARAAAIHNYNMNPDRLIVAEAYVGKGVSRYQIEYRAKGRANRRRQHSSHLRIVVQEVPDTPDEVKLGKWGRRHSTIQRTLERMEQLHNAAAAASATSSSSASSASSSSADADVVDGDGNKGN